MGNDLASILHRLGELINTERAARRVGIEGADGMPLTEIKSLLRKAIIRGYSSDSRIRLFAKEYLGLMFGEE